MEAPSEAEEAPKASSVSDKVSDDDDSSGLGMAEVIAIIVCILIGFAFILACAIMLRNANKRKKMAAEKLRYEEEARNRLNLS